MSKNKKRNKKINSKLKKVNNNISSNNIETKIKESTNQNTNTLEKININDEFEDKKTKLDKEIINKKIDHLNQKILINKLKYALIVILIIIFSFLIINFVILSPNIVLKGDKNLILEVNSDYDELGYMANYLGKDITSNVIVKSNLDTKKIGIYKIEYIITYKGKTKKIKRNIEVKDTTKPVIELVGDKKTYVCPNKEYEELGYKATDNYDGDITSKVEVKYNNDKIIYEVKDSSNNKTSVERKIISEDIEKPVITLNGNSEVIVYLDNNYIESGFSAMDNCDLDITDKVEVENDLILDKVGTYKITYKVKDNSGNETNIERIVKVMNPISTGKVIYLTFDDGPSSITSGILDILKEENVKATFFVIGNANNYPDIIKREINEGHTVALHTFTHSYKLVYNSSEDYFNDLNMIRNTVYNITGKYSNIIRFPGGSSNTVSRNYQKGLMTYLAKEVEKRGFTYFDWNVSSEDAGGARTSSDVYYNVVNNLRYKNNIVLLHDFGGNYKTLNALRDIIRYGKSNGYTFEAITEYTEPVHHRVNN